MATTYGHATSEWETAREWTAGRLHSVARDRSMITYSDLAESMAQAGLIKPEPRSSALATLLGQVNVLEHEAGRPLISAPSSIRMVTLSPGVVSGVSPASSESIRGQASMRDSISGRKKSRVATRDGSHN
jgi:hypothetical protein